jgi:hypothetical protein
MNILEGSRRMQHGGRRILLGALAFFALLVVLFEVWVYLRDSIHPDFVAQSVVQFVFFMIPLAVIAILIGGVLWLAGWILAGFAKHDAS